MRTLVATLSLLASASAIAGPGVSCRAVCVLFDTYTEKSDAVQLDLVEAATKPEAYRELVKQCMLTSYYAESMTFGLYQGVTLQESSTTVDEMSEQISHWYHSHYYSSTHTTKTVRYKWNPVQTPKDLLCYDIENYHPNHYRGGRPVR